MAIDTAHHRLFSGCRSGVMAVSDYQAGKVVATLPIGTGVDGAGYDPASADAFASNADGTLTVIHQDSPDQYHVAETVQTAPGVAQHGARSHQPSHLRRRREVRAGAGRRPRPRAGGAGLVRGAGRSSAIAASNLRREQFDQPGLKRIEIAAEVSRRARVDQPALGDHADFVAQAPNLVRVVTAEERRHVLGRGETTEQVPHVAFGGQIETARGFVEEQHFRAAHQRARDLDAALHAGAVGADQLAAEARIEAHAVEQALDLVGRLGSCRRRAKYSRYSRAVQADWLSLVSSLTSPTSWRTASGSVATSCPHSRAVPAVGGSRVVSTRMVVVLPAPFRPRNP